MPSQVSAIACIKMLAAKIGAVLMRAVLTCISLVNSAAPLEGNNPASAAATSPAMTPVTNRSRLAPGLGMLVRFSWARMSGKNTCEVIPTESPTGHQKKKLRSNTWCAASGTDPSLPTEIATPL
mmetsp:Transcript_63362/g.74959  ORF Transcript_63362/g.74959 Transcript_63362/m.74959 type:complete len:124 (+) Transcript_63362:296-667(+)